MEVTQERLRELLKRHWLTSREVAEILGCTRQHVTWMTRRDLDVTDPTLGLIAEDTVRGRYVIYSYLPVDVVAFRDGPVWRGRSPRTRSKAA